MSTQRRWICFVAGHRLCPYSVHAWCDRCGKFLYFRRRNLGSEGDTA